MHLCPQIRKTGWPPQSLSLLRRFAIPAIFCLSIAADGRVIAESPRSSAGPVTRKEFLEMVFLGMPEEQLLEVIGSPDRRTKNADGQFTDLIYRGRIAASRGAAREDVVVVIFRDYENVYAIKWADGTSVGRD
jgi:hypothetical protein